MSESELSVPRLDVVAAIRGGDLNQAMEDEQDVESASAAQAIFWRDTYQEILSMEKSVMARICELMVQQSESARHEVEMSNVPVIAAQIERFQARFQIWERRAVTLGADRLEAH